MALPLLTRATEDGVTYVLTPKSRLRAPEPSQESPALSRIPDRQPGPGEQYRFHFDMGKCVACKCCVVACNEQNGNPPAIHWRRVGELEAGTYPATQRSFLSMGCNHCLEPTCLSGCPVDAYTKDPATGIVKHSADACIGCQYCTWNCSYGVPQYNPERGVVGKCDMCHGRLSLGQAPACVTACPQGAIQIEIVKTADWRASLAAVTPAAGIPVGDQSLSTTRLTLPEEERLRAARPLDDATFAPEPPHWPLIVMTVLTQLSVGAFATIWMLQVLGWSARLDVAAVAAFAVGGLALTASTLHLGRPIHAYRALRMWRRSWLSREVLLFSAFSGVAALYALLLWTRVPGSVWLGGVTMLLGVAGVTASACIYRVPSRPAWNTRLTILQFVLTSAALGPLFAAAVGVASGGLVAVLSAGMAAAQFTLLGVRYRRLSASDCLASRRTIQLLTTVFAPRLAARGALLLVGGVVLPFASGHWLIAQAALALVIGGELLGRYLFFVSAVPKHLTAPYLGSGVA